MYASSFLAKEKIYLFGNESQTVGGGKTLVEVHKVLLSEEIVLLEGIRLSASSTFHEFQGAYSNSC